MIRVTHKKQSLSFFLQEQCCRNYYAFVLMVSNYAVSYYSLAFAANQQQSPCKRVMLIFDVCFLRLMPVKLMYNLYLCKTVGIHPVCHCQSVTAEYASVYSEINKLTNMYISKQTSFLFKHTKCTHTGFTALDFVWDNPGEPVPEETFTHSNLSWSSVIPYLLPSSIMIHGILPVQFRCLTVFFHNLSPSFLWSTSCTPCISSSNYCLLFATGGARGINNWQLADSLTVAFTRHGCFAHPPYHLPNVSDDVLSQVGPRCSSCSVISCWVTGDLIRCVSRRSLHQHIQSTC